MILNLIVLLGSPCGEFPVEHTTAPSLEEVVAGYTVVEEYYDVLKPSPGEPAHHSNLLSCHTFVVWDLTRPQWCFTAPFG